MHPQSEPERAPMPVDPASLTSIPPHLRWRLGEVQRLLPKRGEAASGVALTRLERLLEDAHPWLAAEPALVEFGLELLDRAQVPQLRAHGAHWLTHFPTHRTVEALARVLREPDAPPSVREQAVFTLGFRQRRDAHAALLWSPDVVAAADAVLAEALERDAAAGNVTLERLPLAARHARSPVVLRALQRAPALFGDALECFADEPLAHALVDALDALSPKHRLRAIRLVFATLGAAAIRPVKAKLAHGELDDRLEALFLSAGLGDAASKDELQALLGAMKFRALLQERLGWHEAHPGVVPTVRGLRVARVTAERPPDEVAVACGPAADDLGALTRFARHPEAYLYTMWAWLVRGARDPARARALVAAHPESLGLVRRLAYVDLARRGRVRQLQATSQGAAGGDRAALELVLHGRPLAGLELAATTRRHTPALVAARVLGCFRAGRADLAERLLKEDLPPAELVAGDELPGFPGPHERWMAEHAPAFDPALTALVQGKEALLALAEAAPDGGEPDAASLDGITHLVKRLGRGLPGATVYFAGEFPRMDKEGLRAAVKQAGAREVHGPFPDTDYYLMGDHCDVTTVAQLERQGTRRLRSGEVEGL